MLTKTQKVWLWISATMFLVPEILWSPVANFLYTLYKGGNRPVILRDNFLLDSDYRKLLIWIVFVQLIGILFFSGLFSRVSANRVIKVVIFLLLAAILISVACVFILLLMTVNI